MTTWTPVSRTQHVNAGWLSYRDYLHAATYATTPLLAAELPKAVGAFPLAFVQQEESYQLVALHSLQPGVNLYINSQGQWLAPYVPAWHRSHPFRLLRNEENDDQILCVDESSTLFQAEASGAAKPFFDAEGNPHQELQETLGFLQECHNNRLLTDKLVQQLANAGLIQRWALQLQGSEGEPRLVEGVFQINVAALRALGGDALSALAASGALAIAYAQLLSADRIREFEQRYRYREQEQAASTTPDFDDLFGENGDSDTLNFGF